MSAGFGTDADAAFRHFTFELIRGRILLGGVRSFSALVRSLPSIYPAIVRDEVEAMMDAEAVPDTVAKQILHEAGRAATVWGEGEAEFPVPHMLDCEWRFSRTANARLARQIIAATDASDAVAFLGTPSLYDWFARQEGAGRSLLLQDANATMLRWMRLRHGTAAFARMACADMLCPTAEQCDTFGSEESGSRRLSAVVADPPW